MKYTTQDLMRLHEVLTHILSKKDFKTGLCIQLEQYTVRYQSKRQAKKTGKLFNHLASQALGFCVANYGYWMLPLTPEGEFQRVTPDQKGVWPVIYYNRYPNTLVPARQKLVQEMLIEIEKRFHDGLHTSNT